MDEIKFVHTNESRGYPYLVFKNVYFDILCGSVVLIWIKHRHSTITTVGYLVMYYICLYNIYTSVI